MAKKIPLRPETRTNYNLTDSEKDCIVWSLISNRPLIDCWMAFVCPDARKQKDAKAENDAWWSNPGVKQFIKDYKSTLNEALSTTPKKPITRDREKEADDALNTFRDNVIATVNQEGITDVDSLSSQAQLLNRIGMLKEEEEQVVGPQRYLPERCNSCAYKQFIDEQVKAGNIIEED